MTEEKQESISEFESIEALRTAYDELKKAYDELLESKNPEYQKSNWQDTVDVFLQQFPEAKNYGGEIGRILIEQPEIRDSKNSLERAYMTILSSRKTPEQLVEDEQFLTDFIYSSERIRDKIIADYLSELNNSTPGVMAKGGETFITPPKSPKNLKEAMNLAEKLLTR